MSTITELIRQVATGNRQARDQLFEASYGELRKLAHCRLFDGGRNTYLATTALVHEVYLKFLDSGQLRMGDRKAFFAYASSVMRSVIIDEVRQRRAARRGGGDWVEITLDTHFGDRLLGDEAEIIHVHDALLALEATEPRLARVVEMRYFGGYTETEVAEALDLTDRTVRRDWEKARLLLAESLRS